MGQEQRRRVNVCELRWLALGLVIAVLPVHAMAGARIVENLFGVIRAGTGPVFTVGQFGAAYRSDDGGVSWVAQKTPTTEDLFSVDFGDAEHGVIVGRSGVVLTTGDGGSTWEARKSPVVHNLFAVRFAGPKHVFAVGDWGTVIESSDSGASWKDRTLDEDVVLTSLSWPTPGFGVIAGEFGTVLVSHDAGASWQKQTTGTDKTLFGVDFRDEKTGWIVGMDGFIGGTQDGGVSWQAQRGSFEMQALETLGVMDAIQNPGFYDVAAAGKGAVVVGDLGHVLVSRDGVNWQVRRLPGERSLSWMRGVAAWSDGALVVGAGGLAIVLDDPELKIRKAVPAAP